MQSLCEITSCQGVFYRNTDKLGEYQGRKHMTTVTGFAGETQQRQNGSFLVPNGQTNKDNKNTPGT